MSNPGEEIARRSAALKETQPAAPDAPTPASEQAEARERALAQPLGDTPPPQAMDEIGDIALAEETLLSIGWPTVVTRLAVGETAWYEGEDGRRIPLPSTLLLTDVGDFPVTMDQLAVLLAARLKDCERRNDANAEQDLVAYISLHPIVRHPSGALYAQAGVAVGPRGYRLGSSLREETRALEP